MPYHPPPIRSIDDVLPHLREGTGIRAWRRDGYTVVDYSFMDRETFVTPIDHECRGLKFDAEGAILARPFHKFFNLGERERVEDVDWSAQHCVLAKLDGSMVHPARLSGELLMMTRGGVTEQARAALGHATADVIALCEAMLNDGITPVFEFTSSDNRIVIAYERAELTLLAARETVSGRYLTHAELTDRASVHGVPVVEGFGSVEDAKAFAVRVRGEEDIEGYVVAFEDGHRLKLKTEAYALRHRALDGLSHEKNLLAWLAKGALDDVLPLLAPTPRERVEAYVEAVERSVRQRTDTVQAFVAEHAEADRKAFAMAAQSLDKPLRSAAFAMLDGRDARGAILKHVEWASHSETRVDGIRDLYGLPAWHGADLAPEAG